MRKAGFRIVVVDDLRSGHKELLPADTILEKIPLENRTNLQKVFSKHRPDAVIDFAAYLAVGESMIKPEKYLENNVQNFIILLDVMAEFDCKHIVKSSTAAVYGNPIKPTDIPWKEEFIEKYQPKISALLSGNWGEEKLSGEKFLEKFFTEYHKITADRPELQLSSSEISKLRIPLSIYGVSKLLDEILLAKYNKMSGINFVTARYFNVCGADPDGKTGDSKPLPTNLMSLAIEQLLGKIPELSVFGDDYPTKDGTGIRDYIHPYDLAVGHILALKYLFSAGKSQIVNFATGEESSVLDVIREVEKATNKKVKYKIVDRRSGDPSISVPDWSKAKKIFNWQTKYRLPEMAKTAWDWETKHKELRIKNTSYLL